MNIDTTPGKYLGCLFLPENQQGGDNQSSGFTYSQGETGGRGLNLGVN